MHLRSLDLWSGRGHEAALLTDVNGKGCWLTPRRAREAGIPSRRRACLGADLGVGVQLEHPTR
jgi:hypothetical protein